MEKNKNISESEFDELCKFVFSHLRSAGNTQLTKETLVFAVYWQICHVLEQQVECNHSSNRNAVTWQEKIKKLFIDRSAGDIDVGGIINQNITKYYTETEPTQNKFLIPFSAT